LSLTPRGENAIHQKEGIALRLPKSLNTSAVLRAKAKLEAGGTVEYTAQLLADGLTPEKVAHQRGLTVMTIYGHCAKLIEAGKLDVDKVVPKDVQEKIEKAIQKAGSTQYLSPIKNILPEEITFEMIRCVVAEYSQTSEVLETSEVSDPKASIQHIVELGETGSSASLPELIAALKSENGNARRLAASALGKIGNAQAVQPLMDLLATEKMPQVRQYAVKALGSIRDPRAMNLLTKISVDENEMSYTRDSARIALQQFYGKTPLANNGLTSDTSTPATSPITSLSPNSQLAPPSTQHATFSTPDAIISYLSASHPRPLTGNWNAGFALDFHSSFQGADWNRSEVGDLTYRLKYQSNSSALPALVEFTRKLFAAHPEMGQFDLILPVPSSTQRDFNPVHEFCKALSWAVNKPMQTCITKTRQTRPQKEMKTLPQKRDNVAGAFAINSDITGKRVLLIDDLFDSGATLEEITRLLLQHRAARVNVLTLTRTIHANA
jgi:hypothetical protein